MNPELYAVIEPILIVLIVGVSALFSLRKIAPGMLTRFGRLLRKAGSPARLASLFEAQSEGCGSACGSCSNCGPSSKAEIIILQRSKNQGSPDTLKI
jgi:hypothetical protein